MTRIISVIRDTASVTIKNPDGSDGWYNLDNVTGFSVEVDEGIDWDQLCNNEGPQYARFIRCVPERFILQIGWKQEEDWMEVVPTPGKSKPTLSRGFHSNDKNQFWFAMYQKHDGSWEPMDGTEHHADATNYGGSAVLTFLTPQTARITIIAH